MSDKIFLVGHKKRFILLLIALFTAAILFFVLSRSQQPQTKAIVDAQRCGECHAAVYQQWQNSQHARANQAIDPEQFAQLPDRPAFPQQPVMQIGVEPLIQYIIENSEGRFQVFNQAYDPEATEWFDVFAGDERKMGEWGHWQGRGMNWNSQCAVCHMTGYDKAYDVATDNYHSTWQVMGITCIQCHGGMDEHPNALSVEQITDNCAACHARREELQGGFKAGDRYADFFRPMWPDQTELFYPDGQAKAEIFEYNSFQLSRMGHAGVTCLDCHNPHSGKLKLPVANNALCLSCHQAPGKRGAIPIDPATHSHHAPDSPGSQCINCHMPAHPYMVRDARRDHRFVIPDPQLTKEWGIPNACNACHADRSADWAIQKTEAWYGDKMKRRSRQRAQALARAQAGDIKVGGEILRLAREEENPAWRATLISHLIHWLGTPDVNDFLLQSLKDPSPWVRSAAVQVLQYAPDTSAALKKMTEDPTRLVRLDADWALALRGQISPEQRNELESYLNFHADQPTGALKWGQLSLAENKLPEAIDWLSTVVSWDPASAYGQYMMGRALYAAQELETAQRYMETAAQLEPDNAEYTYNLALLYAELGQPEPAIQWLEKTVALNPEFGRAWFNLGVAYFQSEKLEKAITALKKAQTLMPLSPDPPQVLEEIYRSKGNAPRLIQ